MSSNPVTWRPHPQPEWSTNPNSRYFGTCKDKEEAEISQDTAKKLGVEIPSTTKLIAQAEVNDPDKLKRILRAHADLCSSRNAHAAARLEFSRVERLVDAASEGEKTDLKTQLTRCYEAKNRAFVNEHFCDFKKQRVEENVGMRTESRTYSYIDTVELAKYANLEQRTYYFENMGSKNLIDNEIISLIRCGVTADERTLLKTKLMDRFFRNELFVELAKADTVTTCTPPEKADSKVS